MDWQTIFTAVVTSLLSSSLIAAGWLCGKLGAKERPFVELAAGMNFIGVAATALHTAVTFTGTAACR